jgi:predicted GIY-YIG superfamily endonuclease
MARVIYLLHLDPAFRHARHYLGSTDDVERRLLEHMTGRGSPLVRAAVNAGCVVELAATWEGSRTDERRLHSRKESPRLCPICRTLFGTHRRPSRRARRAET